MHATRDTNHVIKRRGDGGRVMRGVRCLHSDRNAEEKFMVLAAEERDALLSALESNGWFWEGGFIYVPHKTMWLLGANPWPGDLSDFYERRSARVERIAHQEAHYNDLLQHQRVISDTQSLVDTLKELLNPRDDI